ncbi:MAG: hypothetical protein K2G12_10890 [Prevotella sp.]|nr:hypothetical protein [Prevotella sp.]
MLTNNDVGYWRKEKWIDPICGYSKRDSSFCFYNENMIQDHDYHIVWYERSKHEFRISNDTIYHYHVDKLMDKCHPDDTDKIISFKRNRLRLVHIPTEWEKDYFDCSKMDTITFVRVKNRDIKRLRKGKKVTYKDCKDGGYKIVVEILDRNDRRQQEKQSQEE